MNDGIWTIHWVRIENHWSNCCTCLWSFHLELHKKEQMKKGNWNDWTTTQERTLQIVDCCFCLLGFVCSNWIFHFSHRQVDGSWIWTLDFQFSWTLFSFPFASRHPSVFGQNIFLDCERIQEVRLTQFFPSTNQTRNKHEIIHSSLLRNHHRHADHRMHGQW